MIWMLIVAVLSDAFSVISRSAIISFSLADLEERLRKQDRIQADMPRFEAFTEIARDVAFTFLFITQFSKAIGAICIFAMFKIGYPELNDFELGCITVLGFSFFLLISDTFTRPIATEKAEAITHYCLPIWKFIHVCMYIPIMPFRLISNGITSLITSGEEKQDEDHADDEIIAAVAFGEAQGHILEEEREMIEAVLEFQDRTAADVMSPRTDMSAAPLEEGTIGALEIVKETGHSRLPVYSGNRDNIVGILYAKDLIGVPLDALPDLESLLRPPVLVPASKALSALLAEMRHNRVHLAVVLDEYGGTAGLVSIEDIFEEVFGEIEDEYDTRREEEVRQLDVATYDLDARMKVEEVNERFDYNLPLSDNYESLGGLVTSFLGCIPKMGEVWISDDGSYSITVIEATPRRLVRVTLERQAQSSDSES